MKPRLLCVFTSLISFPTPIYSAHPLLDELGSNSAIDLGPFTDDPYDGACGVPISITDYSGLAYDSVRNKILAHGGGHSATGRDDVPEFSLESLMWSHIPAGTYPGGATALSDMSAVDEGRFVASNNPISTHTADLMPFVPTTGELVVLRGYGPSNCFSSAYGERPVAHYHALAKTWQYATTRTDTWESVDLIPSSAYDPISGMVIIVGGNRLWVYNPVVRASVAVVTLSQNVAGYNGQLVYVPANDRFYYFSRTSPIQTWEIAVEGPRGLWQGATISELQTTNSPNFSGSSALGFAVDTQNNVIAGDVDGDVIKIFHPDARAWQTLSIQYTGTSIGTIAGGAIVYVPSENVFIFLTSYSSGSRTWAYRYAGASPPVDLNAPAPPSLLQIN